MAAVSRFRFVTETNRKKNGIEIDKACFTLELICLYHTGEKELSRLSTSICLNDFHGILSGGLYINNIF